MRRLALLAVAALAAGCGPGTKQKLLCATNLKRIWLAQHLGGQKLPASTGRQFWLDRQSKDDLDAYVCPLSGKAAGSGSTTYRGPDKDVNTAAVGDVVGACVGIHSDGSVTVLRKDGSVVIAEKGDPAAAEARTSTTD